MTRYLLALNKLEVYLNLMFQGTRVSTTIEGFINDHLSIVDLD